jgi:hypothetical protein
VEKLSGKSEWVPNWDSEGRQEEGVKELPSAASCRQRRTLGRPLGIFQTVSEEEFSEVRLRACFKTASLATGMATANLKSSYGRPSCPGGFRNARSG